MEKFAGTAEAELIRRTLAGEGDAFADLIRRHEAAVTCVAQRWVGSRQEAEDVAQETFVKAYRALRSFDTSRPLAPWLYRIAANLSINRLKRERPTVAIDGEDGDALPLPDGGPGPEAQLLQAEFREQVQREVAALPHHYRQVIEMRHAEALAYEEIADLLDVPVSDVKSWLFRARRRLRERLQGWWEG